MSFLNYDVPIDLPCPGCGEKTPKTLGWLKDEPDSFVCGGCGKTVALDFTEPSLRSSLDSIEKSIERLKRTLKNFNK